MKPDFPFSTDGCSGPRCLWRVLNIAMFGALGSQPPFEWACEQHDVRYYAGGTEIDKAIADRELRVRVVAVLYATGHHRLARPFGFLTELGVNVFGGPERNTSYRWTYGYRFRRGRRYQTLTAEERVDRDVLLAARYEQLRERIAATGGDPVKIS